MMRPGGDILASWGVQGLPRSPRLARAADMCTLPCGGRRKCRHRLTPPQAQCGFEELPATHRMSNYRCVGIETDCSSWMRFVHADQTQSMIMLSESRLSATSIAREPRLRARSRQAAPIG